MRIGIITGEYPPMQGGVGAYTHILAHEMAAQGEEVFLFSSANAHSDDLPLTNTVRHWNLSSLRVINQWVKVERLDIVNLQFQTAAYGMSPWIHFLPDITRRAPVVTTFHDLRYPYLFPKAGPLRDWIVHHLAAASSGAIVTNHEDHQRLKHLPQTTLIPIGSNIRAALPAGFDPLRQREAAGVRAGEFLLAYFGLQNQSKGVEILLESLAALRQQGIPARLLMIGGRAGSSDPTNAAYANNIDQLIARLRLDQVVGWTGYLDETEVAASLSASDAVVLPYLDGASYRRGSLMAAVQYGCPIVTTIPRVHIPEFVHGENMLFVPAGVSQALTETLSRLLADTTMQAHLRQGAAKLARHFGWSHITRDYLAFFRHIIGAAA